MIVYLASPRNQAQAAALDNMPVLLSFGCFSDWIHDYQASFSKVLIDSGAFSVMNSGAELDVMKYREWSEQWLGHADAIAGLDDIDGDWRKSLANYEAVPWGFPTIHDTDPPEFLDELVPMARERGNWLGIGLKPPRSGKERFIRSVVDRVPEDLHLHLWAGREYTHIRQIDSVDSTNWWRDALGLRSVKDLHWLTIAECLEIIVKREKRWLRNIRENDQIDLF